MTSPLDTNSSEDKFWDVTEFVTSRKVITVVAPTRHAARMIAVEKLALGKGKILEDTHITVQPSNYSPREEDI